MIQTNAPGRRKYLLLRTLALFVSFLFIIVAYYQVKVASRSLLLEYGGPQAFPYVWIGSALVLLLFISIYQKIIQNVQRSLVIILSLIATALILIGFWYSFAYTGFYTMVCFYIFVDIFSVILVEQFWSLANAVSRTGEGHKTYWFVGSGGLIGGIIGSAVASILIKNTFIQTEDLLLSCAALLLLTAAFNLIPWKYGLYKEVPETESVILSGEGLKILFNNRFLQLIAIMILLSQLVEPIVEFQFLTVINENFHVKDQRTEYISNFFIILGIVAVAVNLFITPFIHRYIGAVAGLFVQPITLMFTSMAFVTQMSLNMAATLKVSDRGLSYSINRASKELLYVPVEGKQIFQVKAWIDMLGYRLFKILGAGMILLVSVWPASNDLASLSYCTMFICTLWIWVIITLSRVYSGTIWQKIGELDQNDIPGQ